MAAKVLQYHATALKKEDGSAMTNEMRLAMKDAVYFMERLMASDLGLSVSADSEENMDNIKTFKDIAAVMEHRRAERPE